MTRNDLGLVRHRRVLQFLPAELFCEVEGPRPLTTRATCTSDSVLSTGLFTIAIESRLLATRAHGLAGAKTSLARAAATSRWDGHDRVMNSLNVME